MRFFSWLLLCLFLISCVAGCSSGRELERTAFVLTMGIDKGENGFLNVIFRVAIPRSMDIRAGGETTTLQETTKPVTITARSISEAISLASTNIERKLDFRHLRIVLMGEELAREGLVYHQIDALERNPEFRRTTYVLLTEGPAREIFLSTRPVLERSVSRYVDGIMSNMREQGYSRAITIHDFVSEMETYHVDPVLPMLKNNPMVLTEKKDSKIVPMPESEYVQRQKGKTEPGGKTTESLIRSGGNPTEFIGIGIFHQGKLIEKWSGWDAKAYNLLRDTYDRAIWTFTDPSGKFTYAIELNKSREPKVNIDWDNETPHISITLSLEGDLRSLQSLQPYVNPDGMATLENNAASSIEELIRQVIVKAQEKKIDPFFLSRYVRMRMAYIQDLQVLKWREDFSRAQVDVHVNVKIRRPGLRIQPAEEYEYTGG
ncbi:Ger(x)C family spore germination protein [Heliobacterium chlorum]|uniref:Ger(X)C family spore germination protein n=1 Tax=Heliobacterium chlorum TaxID=2698 RepID=A0ABR7T4I4_HELCL|nr:Ger(x)C family spore germination protein [Heliobacterium chlorum]MBC9785690.1 Ger(x)C family spore germination protein [Heliobacterium chlorum]